MLQAISASLVAKVCVATVVTSAAGAVTYVAVEKTEKPETVEATLGSSSEDKPDTLAFTAEKTESDEESAAEAVEKKEEPVKDDLMAIEVVEEKPVTTEPVEKEEPADTDPPDIVILHPENEARFDDKVIVFEGKAEPGSKVFAGPYPATMNDDGTWRIELVLSPGANKATLSATDAAGNIGYDSVTVYLDVKDEPKDKPKEEPKDKPKEEPKDEVADVAFSANQKYGECGEEVPYDIFWGTATPHTTVTISSPYGSKTLEVGKKGHWEGKVYFEGAPRNQGFLITVSGANGSKQFDFWVGGEGDHK